jgi:hypothetical protein
MLSLQEKFFFQLFSCKDIFLNLVSGLQAGLNQVFHAKNATERFLMRAIGKGFQNLCFIEEMWLN